MRDHQEEPFPTFLRTCTDLELVTMQHEARQAGDSATVTAVLVELKRRVEAQLPAVDNTRLRVFQAEGQ